MVDFNYPTNLNWWFYRISEPLSKVPFRVLETYDIWAEAAGMEGAVESVWSSWIWFAPNGSWKSRVDGKLMDLGFLRLGWTPVRGRGIPKHDYD